MTKTYSKLRGRIVELYGSQKQFAKAIGLSEQSVVAKLNCRSDFSQSDIIKWCNILKIDTNEVASYFFEN